MDFEVGASPDKNINKKKGTPKQKVKKIKNELEDEETTDLQSKCDKSPNKAESKSKKRKAEEIAVKEENEDESTTESPTKSAKKAKKVDREETGDDTKSWDRENSFTRNDKYDRNELIDKEKLLIKQIAKIRENLKVFEERDKSVKRTIFVQNISTRTDRYSLQKHFEKYGKVECVELFTRDVVSNVRPQFSQRGARFGQRGGRFSNRGDRFQRGGRFMNRGGRFAPRGGRMPYTGVDRFSQTMTKVERKIVSADIRFEKAEDAINACQENGEELEGHHLLVNMSQSKFVPKENLTAYITNVDSNISEEVLWKYFTRFGKIKDIHLVRKNAYVQFESKTALKHALKAKKCLLNKREEDILPLSSSPKWKTLLRGPAASGDEKESDDEAKESDDEAEENDDDKANSCGDEENDQEISDEVVIEKKSNGTIKKNKKQKREKGNSGV